MFWGRKRWSNKTTLVLYASKGGNTGETWGLGFVCRNLTVGYYTDVGFTSFDNCLRTNRPRRWVGMQSTGNGWWQPKSFGRVSYYDIANLNGLKPGPYEANRKGRARLYVAGIFSHRRRTPGTNSSRLWNKRVSPGPKTMPHFKDRAKRSVSGRVPANPGSLLYKAKNKTVYWNQVIPFFIQIQRLTSGSHIS